MTDQAQLESFKSEKERIKDQNNRILFLYQSFPNDRFSAREVQRHIPDISLNSIRRSISSLSKLGFLDKNGRVNERGKHNNRWRWNGRYEPIEIQDHQDDYEVHLTEAEIAHISFCLGAEAYGHPLTRPLIDKFEEVIKLNAE